MILSKSRTRMGLDGGSAYTFSGSDGRSDPDRDDVLGGARCAWVGVTKDGRYTYVVNTGAGTLPELR